MRSSRSLVPTTLAMPRPGWRSRCLMDAFPVAAFRSAADQRPPRTLQRARRCQGKRPCPNQPHHARILAPPPPGRARPPTAPSRRSHRSRRCHRRSRTTDPSRHSHRSRCRPRSRRRTRAHSGLRPACSARRCRGCAMCCTEAPAMRSPARGESAGERRVFAGRRTVGYHALSLPPV
jgi:hypothetical protein